MTHDDLHPQVTRALTDHAPTYRKSYDNPDPMVWSCGTTACNVVGTYEHCIEHQGDEVLKVIP